MIEHIEVEWGSPALFDILIWFDFLSRCTRCTRPFVWTSWSSSTLWTRNSFSSTCPSHRSRKVSDFVFIDWFLIEQIECSGLATLMFQWLYFKLWMGPYVSRLVLRLHLFALNCNISWHYLLDENIRRSCVGICVWYCSIAVAQYNTDF